MRDRAAFEEMRAHVLKMYDGVQPVHTFVSDGALFDCIATGSQPAQADYRASRAIPSAPAMYEWRKQV